MVDFGWDSKWIYVCELVFVEDCFMMTDRFVVF